jgi:Leucine-rich repeat (LRR) protein
MKATLLPLLSLLAVTALAADPKPDAGPAPSAAETAAVAELAKLGIDARPIAAGINWRSATVRVTGAKPDPKIFTLLKDIATLQELDLAGQQIADADLAPIAGLTNLRKLHLEKTPITDAALAHLKGLTNLTYLNIYGTQVTDAGLPQFAGLTNLKSLYVFETKVTDAGIAALKKSLPNVTIVKGWSAEDIAKLTAKPEEKKPMASPEIAAAQKKLDDLNAEIAKRREARAAKTQGTPEWEAANKAVQDIKPDIEKATAALATAKAKLK